MVVDLDLLYLSLKTHSFIKLAGQILYDSRSRPPISVLSFDLSLLENSHNSLDLNPGLGGQYSKYPKFCRVVDLRLFHEELI